MFFANFSVPFWQLIIMNFLLLAIIYTNIIFEL